VVRQDAELALQAPAEDKVGVALEQQTLNADDPDGDWHLLVFLPA